MLACALSATANPRDPADQGHRPGSDAVALQKTQEKLEGAGLTPTQTEGILRPAQDAARDGLPSGTILSKIDEGVAKHASPEALAAAAEKRAACLREATRIVEASGGTCKEESGQALVSATALCLESGLDAERLSRVLHAGGGGHAMRIAAVMEAGEALHLAGLDHDTVEKLMIEFARRNLRRGEILRAVDFAERGKANGLDGPAILNALWPEAKD